MNTLETINNLLNSKNYYFLFNFQYVPSEKRKIKRIEFEKKENSEKGTFYAVFDGENGEFKQQLMQDELRYGLNYIKLCIDAEKHNKRVIGRIR